MQDRAPTEVCAKRVADSIGGADNPLRVAVIGSGPSGFYASEALLRLPLHAEVDMFERLPMPYGLVRSGVAPDHPKLKQVIEVFAKIADSPGFAFFGNVTVGRDVAVETLKSCYHALIFACGAETDRELDIPGEDLPGSYAATEFVGWYNGHPEYRDKSFDLSHEVAVVIGQGNVAADITRILAKSCDDLEHTDIAHHALEALRQSRVTDIFVVGRRGPAQAKFTAKELREFGEMKECHPVVHAHELLLNAQSEAELADKANLRGRQVYKLFQDFSNRSPCRGVRKRVHFAFLKSPVELCGSHQVQAVKLEINTLTGGAFRQSAHGTGKFIEIEAGVVFRSIGYRGVAVPGLPFDHKRGVIPNVDGRIVDKQGRPLAGLYVTGWIKRGPTGIIGTNRSDSVATVNSVLHDLPALSAGGQKPGASALTPHLRMSGLRHVNFSDWLTIDRNEIARGAATGKPREKFTRIEEMLRLLNQPGKSRD